jgi:hypothetical protein
MTTAEGRACVARTMWASAEPFALFGLACPEMFEAMSALGVPRGALFLAVRGAPLGRASAGAVAASFHAFPRSRFEDRLLPVWDITTPEAVIDASHSAITAMAARVLDAPLDDVSACADLLVTVAGRLDTSGRPLAAGNQAIATPDDPWARLWRAWMTLREYRGDAHVATLVSHDLAADEAQVLSTGWAGGDYDVDMLRTTRFLTDDVWSAAVEALHARGLVDATGTPTEQGRDLRGLIEQQTDTACMRAWSQLTPADLARVHALTLALSSSIVDAGLFPARTAVGAPWPPPPLTA